MVASHRPLNGDKALNRHKFAALLVSALAGPALLTGGLAATATPASAAGCTYSASWVGYAHHADLYVTGNNCGVPIYVVAICIDSFSDNTYTVLGNTLRGTGLSRADCHDYGAVDDDMSGYGYNVNGVYHHVA